MIGAGIGAGSGPAREGYLRMFDLGFRRRARGPAALLLCLLAAASWSRGAAAETFTFRLQNSYPGDLQVEFCSEDRNHSWPGGGQAYLLKPGNPVSFPLKCRKGETICYGAWVDGDATTYWGSGADCAEECDDCCYVCDGSESEVQELTE